MASLAVVRQGSGAGSLLRRVLQSRTAPHPTGLPPAGFRSYVVCLPARRARREDRRAMIQDDPRQAEVVEAYQAAEANRRAEFNRYFAVRAHMGNLAFAPDGRQIAYLVNTSGQFNIWRQAITGGWASQVTTFERETVRGLIWSPAGDVIAAADSDGSEQYQIFSIPATGGAVRSFTDRPDAQFELSPDGLSPDGRFLAFAGNDRNPTDAEDRKSTRLNSSHPSISYAVFCLKKKNIDLSSLPLPISTSVQLNYTYTPS